MSGSVPVVVRNSSADGAGWGFSTVDQITSVTGGVLYIKGDGGVYFFATLSEGPPTTYTAPDSLTDTLVKNSDGTYTYTTINQVVRNFDSSGRQISLVAPSSVRTTFSYDGASNRLSTILDPDGSTATFVYDESELQTITAPGSRVTTAVFSSGDLANLTAPEGGTHTYTYGAAHRMTGEQWGPQRATMTYDSTNKTLTGIDCGSSVSMTLAAQLPRGLQTSPARNASDNVALWTDAQSKVTTSTLDTLGRWRRRHLALRHSGSADTQHRRPRQHDNLPVRFRRETDHCHRCPVQSQHHSLRQCRARHGQRRPVESPDHLRLRFAEPPDPADRRAE